MNQSRPSRPAWPSRRNWSRDINVNQSLVIGTSSSESVFPQLIGKLKRLGVEESVVGLVLPAGYSFNHDGACLYFAAVAVFLAQATGTALGWEQQLPLLVVLLVTSKGGAGVAGSAIAVLAMTLAATRAIPVNSIALIFGKIHAHEQNKLPSQEGKWQPFGPSG
ncbi:cation:dicarboxylate symporter family transporter [Candidatus Pantoea formicae]|uniref:cation:dicarboxylate symporter family transporter n=1 Tax=Candidatus Pantoea formicae TaxID=2608355 RepID=UPI003EDABCB8